MRDIRISVIIPLYNGADRIIKCIDMFDAQDCAFDYEVLVIDDCSTDNSAALVAQHLKELHHSDSFHLIRSPKNGRAGAARNAGVVAAKGHYILFNDQDDFPDTKMLRVLWENSKDGQVDLVSCAVLDRWGSPYFRPEIMADYKLSAEERGHLFSRYGYVFASLIKRSVLIKNNLFFPENLLFEDCLYNAGLLSCVGSVQTIKDVLHYRTTDPSSQTASITSKKINDRIDAVKIYLDAYTENDKIHPYMPAIKRLAFYYVYLSCMLWLLAIPKLYTKELFDRCRAEGKALDMSWEEVLRKETAFSKPLLYLLKLIYYVPLMAHPVRLCGTTAYKILKAVKNKKH